MIDIIEFDKCIYIHIPKTGGMFVNYVCGEYGTYREINSLDEIPKGKFIFTFIRNPIYWYASWWAFDKEALPKTILNDLYDKDFDKFIDNVCEKAQGFLTNYFKQFTDLCDFVGETKTLKEDLIKAFELCGQKHDRGKILNTSRINAGEGLPQFINEETKNKILNNEIDIFNICKGKTIEKEVIV